MRTKLNIMKKIQILLLILTSINCQSQTPVIGLETWNGKRIKDSYVKDINNVLNSYEGTWLYTSGTTSLKIILVKKAMAYNTVNYEDLLIGEYQYIENGVEKINTLSEINTVYPSQWQHSISGFSIMKNTSYPKCPECNPEEKRINFKFSDHLRDMGGDMVARLITVGGQPAMKIFKKTRLKPIIRGEINPAPYYSEMNVPTGEYILIKQ